tara:strand:- start:34231 stop:35667 length:1437 start_codon:yes stop_codon:yes gene_type:complete
MTKDMNFLMILPELFVLGMTCIVLLVDLYVKQKRHFVTYALTQLTLVGALVISICLFHVSDGVYFHGLMIHDEIASILKITIYVASFFVFMFSRDYLEQHDMPQGEFYLLGLFSIIGMMIAVSAHSFLTIYLGLELMSLPIYAMVALYRDNNKATEAAIKYFVLGAISSGMLLYGMSMIYGVTHSLDLAQIATVLNSTMAHPTLISVLGVVFIVSGLAFKLGAVPFHMWIPDVYEGAPTAATLFITVAPKVAAFGIVIRLLVDGMASLQVQWQDLLIILAVLSMLLGNVAAIAQTSIKRMLAYSTIAHGGYMLVGLAAATPQGYASSMFYTITYALMSLGGFGMLTILSRKGIEVTNIQDLKGLNTRSPWLAFIMLVLLFSMAGMPPTVGFFAKVGIIEAAVGANLVWLACVTMLIAVVGSYYYLRVVKVMYFEEPTTTTPISMAQDARLGISITGIATIALGILPSALITLCHGAFY